MELEKICACNRQSVNELIAKRWFSTVMVLRGEPVDMTALDGFVAYEPGRAIAGLITYRIAGRECEITSLDSVTENRGVGSALLNRVTETASGLGCARIRLITTNDNLNAMRFYQKRGFDMAAFYRNALDRSRKLKPSIPEVGDFGIPLRHEIEFEKVLNGARSGSDADQKTGKGARDVF